MMGHGIKTEPTGWPLIVVTQPIHEQVLKKLQQHGQVRMNPGHEPWAPEELRAHLAQAQAMLAFMTDCVTAQTLREAPQLRVISCALKGYDNFDLQACANAGVQVRFVADLLTEPTAELAIGLAIAAARHVRLGDAGIRQRGFQGWRPTLYGCGLARSVVSVIGLGAVGKAIVDRLVGFGCAAILGHDLRARDARVESVGLAEAVERADYVFMALPLLADTRHLVNAQLLQRAKPGMVLVNVGRGSVLDEEAVVDALQSGKLGAFASDVFEMEDWHLIDRPRAIHPGLLEHPRTVLTPHLGSAVTQVRLAIEHQAADALIDALAKT